MTTTEQVKAFYDNFVVGERKVGVHLRHYQIFRYLKKHGLKPNHRVLEVGCGIGQVTSLVSGYISSGAILAVDISPKSIEAAKERLSRRPNVTFAVSDMQDFEHKGPFDVIFMPDVLEHIPIEQHPALFATFKKILTPDGFILIHIPNPRFLEWMHENQQVNLQVIDQPLHTDRLLADVYGAGFYLEQLKTYRLFYHQPDYQLLVMKPQQPIEQVSKRNKYRLFAQTLWTRWLG